MDCSVPALLCGVTALLLGCAGRVTEDPSSTANDATAADVEPTVGCAESRAIESLITSR